MDLEKISPEIINQIIIQNAFPTTNNNSVITKEEVFETEDDNSLLMPLKQRKIQINDNKILVQPSIQKAVQSSPQLRRKLPTTPQAREKNQPSIADSLLKMPKGVTIKKTTSNNNNTAVTPQIANKSPITNRSPITNKSPTTNKSPRNVGLPTTSEKMASPSSSGSNQSIVKMRIGDKNVKVQKMRVTKAQAELMAKEGRIKMKDGQMILSRDHL